MAKDSDRGLLEIDMEIIDEEWMGHAKKVEHYHRLLADAEHLVDRLKAKTELVRAELDNLARTSPEEMKIDKITEPAIKNAVIIHPRYQKALRRQHDAELEVGYLKATTHGLENKRRAMENMVELIRLQWYAAPKAREGAMDEVEKRAARAKAKKKLNRG